MSFVDIFSEAVGLPFHKQKQFIEDNTDISMEQKQLILNLLAQNNQLNTFHTEDIENHVLSQISHNDDVFEETNNQSFVGFEVIKPIGQGGMGNVFLAKRNLDNIRQLVAIKTLKEHIKSNKVALDFLFEQRILSQLSHPNIVKFIDCGITDKHLPYIVMEYIDGKFLTDDQFKKSNLNEKLSIFVKITDAIQYMHDRFIVHKDLKPSNILIDEHKQPKVLDFGLAKMTQANGLVPLTQRMTPKYASPELIAGENISVSSDVYSLGLILFEFLSGIHPHDFRNKQLLKSKEIKVSQAVLPEMQHSRFNEDLDLVIMKAMAEKHENRYSSVALLKADLNNLIRNRPISIKKPTVLYRTKKLIYRNQMSFGLACILTAISCFFIWTYVTQNFEIKKSSQQVSALTDVFNLSFSNIDPTQSGKKGATVIKLLETIEKSISENDSLDENTNAFIRFSVSKIYKNLGWNKQALNIIAPIKSLIATMPDSQQVAMVTHIIETSLLTGESDQYIEMLDLVHSDYQSSNQVLTTKGKIEQQKGHYDSAENYFAQVLDNTQPNRQGYLDLCFNLSTIKSKQSNFLESTDLMQQCLKTAQNITSPSAKWIIAKAYHLIGNNHGYNKNFELSNQWYESSIEMKKQILEHDDLFITDVYEDIAINHSYLGNSQKADYFFKVALDNKIDKLGEQHEFLLKTYYNMAHASYRSEAYEKTVKYNKKIYDIVGEDNPKYLVNLSFVHQSLAAAYFKLKDFTSAKKYSLKALANFSSIGKNRFVTNKRTSQLLLIGISIELEDWGEALTQIEELIVLADQMTDGNKTLLSELIIKFNNLNTIQQNLPII